MRGKPINVQRQFLLDCLIHRKLTKDNLRVLCIAGYAAALSFATNDEKEIIAAIPKDAEHIIPRIKNICGIKEEQFGCEGWRGKIITDSLRSLRSKDCPKHYHQLDISLLNLSGLNLERANLYGSSLYGAVFDGCNLSYANLQDSVLFGATFKGANVAGMQTYSL
jgi:hypothetical protein